MIQSSFSKSVKLQVTFGFAGGDIGEAAGNLRQFGVKKGQLLSIEIRDCMSFLKKSRIIKQGTVAVIQRSW